MDARVCARPGCGNPLLPGRKLEDFCSYACRGQMKVEAIQGQTGLSGSKNIKQNKALQSLKRRSVGVPTFAKINSCTYRVDSPKNNGAGWLMEVAPPGGARERWIARVGNWASEPLPLKEAKRAAVAMLREREEGRASRLDSGPQQDRRRRDSSRGLSEKAQAMAARSCGWCVAPRLDADRPQAARCDPRCRASCDAITR